MQAALADDLFFRDLYLSPNVDFQTSKTVTEHHARHMSYHLNPFLSIYTLLCTVIMPDHKSHDPSLIRIPDFQLNLSINNRLDRDAPEVLDNPVRTSVLELGKRVGRCERNHLETSGLPSLNSRRSILEDSNGLRVFNS